MAGYITKNLITMTKLLLVMWLSVAYIHCAPLSDDNMVHNGNYDMVMADDHVPAESMHFQDFDSFYNAELKGNAMSEMEMEESRGSSRMLAPPQRLSEQEKRLRENLETFDVVREKRNQKSLTKGSTQAREHNNDWDKFDYDAYVSKH